MKNINPTIIKNAMDYATYRQTIDTLMENGKTTGDNHSPAMIEYTRMNVVRMKRLDKTTKVLPEVAAELQAIKRPITLLVLTEAWCGDAAQILPVVEHMIAAVPTMTARYILRDEHLDIMDAFLTNGARSIPKYIFLDSETLQVLGTWGPRPADVQKMVMDSKAKMETLTDPDERKAYMNEVKTDVQRWYAKDKTKGIQAEFLAALIGAVEEKEVLA